MAFGQVANFCRPIVHLGVNVDGVFAVPGRLELVVPEALEVGGLAAGPRAGDEQVTAELEVKRGELRIGLLGGVLQALIGGELCGSRGAEIQMDAAKKRLVIGHVPFEHWLEVLLSDLGQRGFAELRWIAANILVVLDARRRHKDEHSGIGVFDRKTSVLESSGATLGGNPQPSFEFHASSYLTRKDKAIFRKERVAAG